MADNSFTRLVVVGPSAGGFGDHGGTQGGLGLRSIRERAALLRGTAEGYSSPESGTGVQVRLLLRNGGG